MQRELTAEERSAYDTFRAELISRGEKVVDLEKFRPIVEIDEKCQGWIVYALRSTGRDRGTTRSGCDWSESEGS